MTSSAKNNHEHITSLCERLGWFGRGQSSFQLFEQVWSWNYEVAFHCLFYSINIYHGSLVIWLLNCQPLVPAVSAEDGQWLVRKPFVPVCKPGGHGVIWKLAYDKGIFQWFYDHGRKGATVRQVRLASHIYYISKLICKYYHVSVAEFEIYFGEFAVMLWLLQMWPSWHWQGSVYIMER